jgi:DNA (cytosine-5)-methyltransferase 1
MMNVLSLFSGCGGLDLGFERAGFSIRLALDSWRPSTESYAANFPNSCVLCKSVSNLTSDEWEMLGPWKAPTVLVGGPPCPPYSKSRFYRKEKPRALEDPIGWETMTGYLRVLEEFRPDAFLLENVAGLAYKVHAEALEHITSSARSLGYSLSSQVLNAADFGVPQLRERFFLVGMLGKTFVFPEPTHRKPNTSDLLSQELPEWVTAGDVLCDLDTEVNASDIGHVAGGGLGHLLKEIPPGDNYLYFTEERGHPNPLFKWRSRYWSFLLKLSPDKPSWTIQARRSNNMGPFHWRNRILRIEEVKRLQTFPDDWRLVGSVEDQWRQVGNAVPPLLAQRLAEALRAQL